jgi:hypothetical protein
MHLCQDLSTNVYRIVMSQGMPWLCVFGTGVGGGGDSCLTGNVQVAVRDSCVPFDVEM